MKFWYISVVLTNQNIKIRANPKEAPKNKEFEPILDTVYFLFPEKYTLDASIPSVPNLSKIVGIRTIRAYIPLFVGPKTRAIIIEVPKPRMKVNTFEAKVIALFFDKLAIFCS